jgi:hypothetical protein
MAGIIVGAKIVGGEAWERKLQAAFEQWARFEVNDYFRDQFNTDRWYYPAVTLRKSGQTAGPGPRDIYDLGNLYRSGRESFAVSSKGLEVTASWDWDAKNSSGNLYAYYVHEGAEKAGNNLMPRQWTDVLVEPTKFLGSSLSKSLKERITIALGR